MIDNRAMRSDSGPVDEWILWASEVSRPRELSKKICNWRTLELGLIRSLRPDSVSKQGARERSRPLMSASVHPEALFPLPSILQPQRTDILISLGYFTVWSIHILINVYSAVNTQPSTSNL